VKRQLEATHKVKVLLTRSGDAYVSLEDRVRFARDANAALMISIHADSLPGDASADVSGTTVYTCSERASDAEAARIAEHENAADRSESGKKPDEAGVADILFDLKRRETRAYAHLFSHGLIGQLRGFGRLNRNPERSAGFMVLKAPDFPSVLVELGYLSNPQDVANMTAPPWRQRAAAALTTAVERFFAPNADGKTPEAIAGDAATAH
jgi:N-acetylmuramoyl-L-alanine amidase